MEFKTKSVQAWLTWCGSSWFLPSFQRFPGPELWSAPRNQSLDDVLQLVSFLLRLSCWNQCLKHKVNLMCWRHSTSQLTNFIPSIQLFLFVAYQLAIQLFLNTNCLVRTCLSYIYELFPQDWRRAFCLLILTTLGSFLILFLNATQPSTGILPTKL